MRCFPRAAWPILALIVALPAAAADRYVLDPEHLSVGFLVHHIGYADTLGMFLEAEGEYTFDEASGELGDLRVVIHTDSVFTNHQARDNHLRSGDFLNVDEYPEMVFSAAVAEPLGERRYRIDGELTLLGETRPVSLEATWNKSGKYPIPPFAYVMGVSARGSFRRSDFGMDYAVDNGWVGDEVSLILEFEARRQE